MTVPIPGPHVFVDGSGKRLPAELYRFLRLLAGQAGAGGGVIPPTPEPPPELQFSGPLSVQVQKAGEQVVFTLRGDGNPDGGNWYYGTNGDGAIGFWPITDAITGSGAITATVDYGPYDYQGELDTADDLPATVVVGDAYLIDGHLWAGVDDGEADGPGWNDLGPFNGTTTLDLTDLPPTAGGAFLLVQFDGKGRRTHEQAGTAADVPFVPAGPITATDVQAAITQAAALGGGGGEILVSDTHSAPPVMLTNEAEDDFLYSD